MKHSLQRMVSLYRFAMRWFVAVTLAGFEQDGSVGSTLQSGRMTSEPTQFKDLIMHQSEDLGDRSARDSYEERYVTYGD